MEHDKIYREITEIVARRYDLDDQLLEGSKVCNFDHNRWYNRYFGEKLKNGEIHIFSRSFAPRVDFLVGNIMKSITSCEGDL